MGSYPWGSNERKVGVRKKMEDRDTVDIESSIYSRAAFSRVCK